ncbi:MAG: transposase [Deltaproteobacteria bacterium]|nr:transposase [Deltaproteobacteria bacterium]
MAKPFIAVHRSKGIEYASICTPKRVDGKKVNNPIYLGRVLNLEEGRFRSKERGEFFYSLEKGYSYPTVDPQLTINNAKARCGLNLGHVYCTHLLLERTGLLNLFRETEQSSPDTLLALLMHRLLDEYADSHANAFMNQTYTCLLYPKADLTSQGISRYLEKLGQESIRKDFHRRYINMMCPNNKSVGVLIDSTGLSNDIDLPITAISNHGGGPVNEIRLIYVVDRETMSPIYYRAIPGNVVDVVTLKATISELLSLNVNIEYSVLDAGYNSESNLEELYSLDINFMTRLISNRGLYKDLLAEHCDSVMNASNRIVYNGRLIFMTMNKVKLPNNRTAYAYIGVDFDKKSIGIKQLSLREDQANPMPDDVYDKKFNTAGMFVMISSLEMDKKEVLPYYYSRQTIEQIFDVSKNYAKMVPLNVQKLSTFNGHILLSFITTIVYLKLQKIFHNTKYNAIDFITELRGVICTVYDDHLLVFEPTARQKEILKILKMEIPLKIPIKT